MLSSTKAKSRILYLDSLRALAATYVVLHHAMLQYYWDNTKNLSAPEKIIVRLFSDGHIAVGVFIVLSGFSLMLAVTKNGLNIKGGSSTFFRRRIIRIVPPYYAALLLCLLLTRLFIGNKTGTLWDISIPPTSWDIVTHLLFIHDFFVSSIAKIAYTFWSISVEFRLYLFFPMLIILWRKKGPWAALLFSFIATVVFSAILIVGKGFYNDISLSRAGVSPYIILFTLGMISADLAFSAKKGAQEIREYYRRLDRWSVVTFFAFAMVLYKVIPAVFKISDLSPGNMEFVTQEIKDILIGLITASFLFVCAVDQQSARAQTWVLGFLNWQPLVFIGTFSYSLYLFHPPLLQLLSTYVLSSVDLSVLSKTWLLLTLGTVVVMVLCYLFFLLFERPFLVQNGRRKVEDTEILAAQNPAP